MQNNIPIELLWIVLAIFGGIARYLDTYLTGTEKFSIGKVVATMFICGFTGFLCAQIFLLIYPSWALVSAGIGGYLGTEAIKVIVPIWKSRLPSNNNKE
jgi:hypothetical protein